MQVDELEALALNEFTITRPDDWHHHLRDGDAMQRVVKYVARVFGRALIMPNLKPPVTTVRAALQYRTRILQALTPELRNTFRLLMTLYLTDKTPRSEIEAAMNCNAIVAAKYYPAGATTNSDSGVTDIRKIYPALAAMERRGMVLCVHGEVTDSNIDIFDREAVFIDRVLIPLRRDFPELKIVLEHITTEDGADYVFEGDEYIAATITPQHLLYNRNALFVGGLHPHLYCLPILKLESDRLALIRAATSGHPRIFLGPDSAPHAQHLKEHACGCAGCFSAPAAIELYTEAFDQAGALDRLEGFASHFGADFYGIPRNTDTITLVREPWMMPHRFWFGNTDHVVPLRAGEIINWQVKGLAYPA
jgi:dihydroorotase